MLEVYRTAGRPVQTTEQIQKGTLAGTRLADDCDALSASDVEPHVGEDNQVMFAGPKGLGKAGDLEKNIARWTVDRRWNHEDLTTNVAE